MNLTNIVNYVSAGPVLGRNKKEYKKNIMTGPVLLVVLGGIIPGLVLKSYWLIITLLLLIVALVSVIIVFVITSKSLTVKRCLIVDLTIYSAWIVEISLLELMYFSIWKGIHISIVLIYVPVIIIPLLIGVKTHKALIRDAEYNTQNITHSKIKVIGFFAGILGMNFAALFKDVEQSLAIIIVLVCFTILNCFMSMGLLSAQKLYYLMKYDISLPKIADKTVNKGDGSPV